MTICYFGDYDPDYTRTRVILMGLKRAGVTVIEINERGKGIGVYYRLWRRLNALRGAYDALVIGYGDRRLLPVFARLIGAKRVIWEALFSLYDNFVFDRKLVKPNSFKAGLYWFFDFIGCHAADCILLDTALHKRYFMETFGIRESKFAHIYVGADTTVFYPQDRVNRSEDFEVEFHGKYFPMQGTDVIVRAAKLLEGKGVHFTLIGSGQELAPTKKLAESLKTSNVSFQPFLPPQKVVEYVRNADVCIGLIGDVPRVVRAIPTKLWEAAAMARVCVNASPGSLEEIFTPGTDVIGVTPGDHEELARKILELKQKGTADAMGRAAYETFKKNGTPELIGASLAEVIRERFPVT
jgi:glycosyltransferase involved in cell wall biosynthesis